MFKQLLSWQIVGSLVRRLADASGGWLLGSGLIDTTTTGVTEQDVAGAVLLIGSLIWSITNKYLLLKKPAVTPGG